MASIEAISIELTMSIVANDEALVLTDGLPPLGADGVCLSTCGEPNANVKLLRPGMEWKEVNRLIGDPTGISGNAYSVLADYPDAGIFIRYGNKGVESIQPYRQRR